MVFAPCEQAPMLNAIQEQTVHGIMKQGAEQCLDDLLILDHSNPHC